MNPLAVDAGMPLPVAAAARSNRTHQATATAGDTTHPVAWRRLKVRGRRAWRRVRCRAERLPTALLVLAALFGVLVINELSYHHAITTLEIQAVHDALLSSRLAVLAMALAGALALLLVLRHGGRVDALKRRHRRALRAEQARLRDLAAERTRELTELARHLQTVREDERQRLARDLHDELGSLLAAAQLTASRLAHRLGDDAAPEVRARLRELSSALHEGIRLKRHIIEDLHPSSLDHLGLHAALEIQAREFGERAELRVHTELEPVQLSVSAQMTAYRLVQEALTNVAKYAQASTVKVTLQRDGQRAARVSVADDGRGFDPELSRASAHGLKGMRYRVESEGGSLHIVSAPGRGTRVAACLPASCEAA